MLMFFRNLLSSDGFFVFLPCEVVGTQLTDPALPAARASVVRPAATQAPKTAELTMAWAVLAPSCLGLHGASVQPPATRMWVKTRIPPLLCARVLLPLNLCIAMMYSLT